MIHKPVNKQDSSDINVAGSYNSVADAVQSCPGITSATERTGDNAEVDSTTTYACTATIAPNIIIASGRSVLAVVGFFLGAVI